jgi:murein DD-endopeptidase MepM/ murein hydrolase activator NlpD
MNLEEGAGMKREERLYRDSLPLPKRKSSILFLLVFILIAVPILVLLITPQESSQKKVFLDLDHQKGLDPLLKERRVNKIDYILKSGDNIYYVLSELNLDPQEIFNLITSTKNTYDLSQVKMGQPLHLTINAKENKLLHLKYDIDNKRILTIEKRSSGFKASIQKVIYETRRETRQGIIESSFFESAIKSGMSPNITLALADIFSGEIDFHTDIRPGDSFRVVFEKKYLAGEFAGYGKILAAEFKNGKDLYTAIFFEDKEGGRDHYDLAGNSLRRQFLRSPLQYRRISSRFSYRRFHPILRIYRPHLGIDYAASPGTPVVAAAKGKIVYAGWKGDYGNFVKIKHDQMYTSTYGHLSRFARGIRRGRYVKQGQVIGYVGSTGLATGPHLDYRLLKGKRYVDPLKIKASSLKSINKKDLPEFNQIKTEMLLALNKTEPFMLTSYISGTYHLIP